MRKSPGPRFSAGRYVLELILALKKEIDFRWVEEYVWHKTTAAPGKWKYRFRDAREWILHFSKTQDFKMYQDAVKAPIGNWTDRMSELAWMDDGVPKDTLGYGDPRGSREPEIIPDAVR